MGKCKDDVLFGSKKPTHEVGEKLCDLFKNPIYINHNSLNLNENENFASCNVKG